MSDLIIRRTHGKTPNEARAAAERIAAQLAEKFDLKTAWEGGQLRFKRPGVAGELTLTGTQAILTIRLGAGSAQTGDRTRSRTVSRRELCRLSGESALRPA